MAFITALPAVSSSAIGAVQRGTSFQHVQLACSPFARAPVRVARPARRIFQADSSRIFTVSQAGPAPAEAPTKERSVTQVAPAIPSEAAVSVPPADDPFSIDWEDRLDSTPAMRAIVAVHWAMTAVAGFRAYELVANGAPAWHIAAAAFCGYLFSDLGTGVYHWAIDNYGDKRTPIFGKQIAGFQGHHSDPIVITKREFCNNVYKICQGLSIPGLSLLLLANPDSAFFTAGWTVFLNLIVLSQLTHAWSHAAHPPALAASLQRAGLLVSRLAHGQHHVSPYEANYCIVSGWWNPLLDSTNVFRHLENAIYKASGVKPRSWLGGDRPPARFSRPSDSPSDSE
eukprot:tig00000093_g3675.t1